MTESVEDKEAESHHVCRVTERRESKTPSRYRYAKAQFWDLLQSLRFAIQLLFPWQCGKASMDFKCSGRWVQVQNTLLRVSFS